ncbi:hypothetical protein A3Q56_05525 [Intoshia linei]|uniref:Fork-head domain-containing protein n=1 Tax=Intoshia linei TaxID=1819745 RepID=A0A177AXN0_9BILA|nr:hypothetical protein A3Q56_05525 [Intoshia linei]
MKNGNNYFLGDVDAGISLDFLEENFKINTESNTMNKTDYYEQLYRDLNKIKMQHDTFGCNIDIDCLCKINMIGGTMDIEDPKIESFDNGIVYEPVKDFHELRTELKLYKKTQNSNYYKNGQIYKENYSISDLDEPHGKTLCEFESLMSINQNYHNDEINTKNENITLEKLSFDSELLAMFNEQQHNPYARTSVTVENIDDTRRISSMDHYSTQCQQSQDNMPEFYETEELPSEDSNIYVSIPNSRNDDINLKYSSIQTQNKQSELNGIMTDIIGLDIIPFIDESCGFQKRYLSEYKNEFDDLNEFTYYEIQKPQLSFKQLIWLSINASENQELTTQQIYNWISDQFLYYRYNSNSILSNAVRYALTANSMFDRRKKPHCKGPSKWYISDKNENHRIPTYILKAFGITENVKLSNNLNTDSYSSDGWEGVDYYSSNN